MMYSTHLSLVLSLLTVTKSQNRVNWELITKNQFSVLKIIKLKDFNEKNAVSIVL